MIVIIGLVILVAAVLVGVAGVFANGGSTHALTDNFAVFGYHVTGSTGVLFLYGIVVGGIGIVGLSLLLTGARRTARRGRAARRELKTTRRDTTVDEVRHPDPPQSAGAPRNAPTHYSQTGTTDAAGEASDSATQHIGDKPAPHRRLGQIFGRADGGARHVDAPLRDRSR
ncbi:hypothetical protein [Nocardia miyunensis]|uniref:hypothetical protein n=1 Tax=Nocardia miyunensis TaxID=282684 RepID=UPI000AB85ADF|nr:hypothetical protein [Nocardia miyunensis]